MQRTARDPCEREGNDPFPNHRYVLDFPEYLVKFRPPGVRAVSEIILAGIFEGCIFSSETDIAGAVKVKLCLICLPHLLVTDAEMAPGICIIGKLVNHHFECLDCGIEIFGTHVHDPDLFERLPKCEQALGTSRCQFHCPQAGFDGIGLVTQLAVTGPPVVPDICKGIVHLECTIERLDGRPVVLFTDEENNSLFVQVRCRIQQFPEQFVPRFFAGLR